MDVKEIGVWTASIWLTKSYQDSCYFIPMLEEWPECYCEKTGPFFHHKEYIFLCSSRSSVSEEHIMDPSTSVCSVFPAGLGNVHDRGHCCTTMESEVIVGTHRCTKMTTDHISATKTYVMCREEHLSNISVLQRVHVSNIVFFTFYLFFWKIHLTVWIALLR
jgi:hypothetical protein